VKRAVGEVCCGQTLVYSLEWSNLGLAPRTQVHTARSVAIAEGVQVYVCMSKELIVLVCEKSKGSLLCPKEVREQPSGGCSSSLNNKNTVIVRHRPEAGSGSPLRACSHHLDSILINSTVMGHRTCKVMNELKA
jgi:hypothetical protein